MFECDHQLQVTSLSKNKALLLKPSKTLTCYNGILADMETDTKALLSSTPFLFAAYRRSIKLESVYCEHVNFV